MSHRSGPYSGHSHRHPPHEPLRPQQVRRPPPPAQPDRSGYTLAHAGHQVRIGPVVFWIVIGSIVLMGGWSAATATYFAFRDDVLTRLIAREAEMQYAYEDRIAELRTRVDRTTSRQMIDQEQFDQKLTQIMRRQALLESRASALGVMPDVATTGSIRPQRALPSGEQNAPSSPKPSLINDTAIFTAPPDREARLESRAPATAPRQTDIARSGTPDNALSKLQRSLDQVEGRQMAALDTAEDTYEIRARRMRGVFTDLGLDMAQMEAAAPKAGVGGPSLQRSRRKMRRPSTGNSTGSA